MFTRVRERLENRRAAAQANRAIRSAKRISLGTAGVEQEPGWLGTDRDLIDLTDRLTFARYWRPGTRYAFLAEHVWEHLTYEQAIVATKNCFEFLRPGGWLRLAVPDGNFPDSAYIEWVRPGGNGPGADDHKVLWTEDTIGNLMTAAGFQVRSLEWWDATGHFHAEAWSREDGYIDRSSKFDSRNEGGVLRYTSIIIDGHKPIK